MFLLSIERLIAIQQEQIFFQNSNRFLCALYESHTHSCKLIPEILENLLILFAVFYRKSDFYSIGADLLSKFLPISLRKSHTHSCKLMVAVLWFQGTAGSGILGFGQRYNDACGDSNDCMMLLSLQVAMLMIMKPLPKLLSDVVLP